jgi:hypothetical protein
MQALPPEEESNVESGIVRWIPYVPVIALIFLVGIFLIWAEIL